MEKKTNITFAAVAIIALLAIIASQSLTVSDFVSGFILGVGIVGEVVALFQLSKNLKAK